MGVSRRSCLRFVGAALLSGIASGARAQSYPSRAIRWVVGFPPGGSSTIVTRIMADWLSRRVGQPVVVENKPGASGNIAVQEVVRAASDGYTLLLLPASAVVNRAVFANLSFDVLSDIEPVSGLIEFPLVMIVTPDVPATTVNEFIGYAKSNPGKLNMASFGTGTTSHLAGELFQMMTGTKLVHVPYRGEAPALADMIGGRIQVMFDVLTGSLQHIRAGKLRAIAVAGRRRDPALPDVPTIGETVAGYEANSWIGVGAPKGTNREIVATLNREINAGLAEPELQSRLAEIATRPQFFTPAEFGRYLASEAQKWAEVVRRAGLKQN